MYASKILDYNHRFSPQLTGIYCVLLMYIQNNNGEFPLNKEDLIEQGYLRITQKDNEIIYEITEDPNSDCYWWDSPYFNEFKISYGIQAEDIKIENDMVIDIRTGKPIYLVEAPLFRGFRGLDRRCRLCSVSLAEEMLKIQGKKRSMLLNEQVKTK